MMYLLAWMMSCSEYHGTIQRLYENPFFAKPENIERRRDLHEFFKTKTWPECLELET